MNNAIDIRSWGLDSKTAGELYARHRKMLVNATREALGAEDDQDAEDLVQDVFVQLLDGTISLGAGNPARELLGIVRGIASKRRRGGKRRRFKECEHGE
jgi:DNA-directed RNA polymerase specialized sigma24 family protein